MFSLRSSRPGRLPHPQYPIQVEKNAAYAAHPRFNVPYTYHSLLYNVSYSIQNLREMYTIIYISIISSVIGQTSQLKLSYLMVYHIKMTLTYHIWLFKCNRISEIMQYSRYLHSDNIQIWLRYLNMPFRYLNITQIFKYRDMDLNILLSLSLFK